MKLVLLTVTIIASINIYLILTAQIPANKPVGQQVNFNKNRTGEFPDERIQVGGEWREYRLIVPEKITKGKKVPLVFAFHGLGDSKDMMPRYSHLDELAKEQGFILVYPNAREKYWPLSIARSRDDLAFFDTLFEHLKSQYDIDQKRVYLTGMSNGAYFINVIASQRSEMVAAIAQHSGGLGILGRRGIDAKRKYSVMIIHGDADRIVPIQEARRTRDVYIKENHEVEYIEVAGLGHRWAHKENINEKIWSFFMNHPLR